MTMLESKARFLNLLQRRQSEHNDHCTICDEGFQIDDDDEKIIALPCNHDFHRLCLVDLYDTHLGISSIQR